MKLSSWTAFSFLWELFVILRNYLSFNKFFKLLHLALTSTFLFFYFSIKILLPISSHFSIVLVSIATERCSEYTKQQALPSLQPVPPRGVHNSRASGFPFTRNLPNTDGPSEQYQRNHDRCRRLCLWLSLRRLQTERRRWYEEGRGRCCLFRDGGNLSWSERLGDRSIE